MTIIFYEYLPFYVSSPLRLGPLSEERVSAPQTPRQQGRLAVTPEKGVPVKDRILKGNLPDSRKTFFKLKTYFT